MAEIKTPFKDAVKGKLGGQPSGAVEVNGEPGLPKRDAGKGPATVVRKKL